VILYTLLTHWGSRIGTLVGGLLVVAVGAYFLLRNAFGFAIPDINWDLVWPVVVIVTGLAILARAIDQPGPSSITPGRPVSDVSSASHQPGDLD
jgi:hypothetical protein